MLMPIFIPVDYSIPPTLYRILNSRLNFDSETKTKIRDLAKNGREYIFDFTYPLSSNVDKETFEVSIINHFLMRRIGYETMTSFLIALDVKMNEIMPYYNKLFDMMEGWDIFNDGESMTREVEDSRNRNEESSGTNSLSNQTSTSNTSDRRFSKLPQTNIQDVQSGTYLTEYSYDTDSGSATSSSTGSETRSGESEEQGNLLETISRSPSDKMKLYESFLNNKNKIMTMIYKDLDSLFYQVI